MTLNDLQEPRDDAGRDPSLAASEPVPAGTPTAPPVLGWLPIAAAATTLLLWASAFVAIRHLGSTVGPGALSLGRLLVAALALGVMVAWRARRAARRGAAPLRLTRRETLLLLLCGVAWFGVYNLALNAAEQRIDAGTAALVIQIGPVVVALLATVFLGESLTRWLIIGMAVGFAGVVVIGLGSAESSDGDIWGVALTVVAALTFAVGVLCQKPLLRRLPALELTWMACVIGAVVCLPWAGDLLEVIRTAPGSSLFWIGYLGLAPTALAFTTWAYALTHTDAGKLALTTFLVPLLTTLIAWALLAEVPPPLAFAGGALCIIGVLLTRRGAARARPARP